MNLVSFGFHDRFHDELAVGQNIKSGVEPNPLDCGISFRAAQLPRPDGPIQRRDDPSPPGCQRSFVEVDDGHVQASASHNLGDSRPHQPAANDPNPVNSHHSSFSQPASATVK
jgi:hypothetical protein